MTREIKFRGKAADVEQPSSGKMHKAGEWVYGNLCGHPDKIEIEEVIRMSSKYWHIPSTIIDPNTVGQFTGLHDKNGKEIYEGDILVRRVINDGCGTHDKEPLEVVFMNGAFGIRLDRGKVYEEFEWICKEHSWSSMGASGETKYEYEVIGNIYDNPELLKEN